MQQGGIVDLSRVVSGERMGSGPTTWTEFSGNTVAGGGGFGVVIIWKHVSVMSITCSN